MMMDTNENKKYFKDLYKDTDSATLYRLRELESEVSKSRNIKEPIRILHITRYGFVKDITFCTEFTYQAMKATDHLG